MKPEELKVGMEIENKVIDRLIRRVTAIGKRNYLYTAIDKEVIHKEQLDTLCNVESWQPVKKTKKVTLYRYLYKSPYSERYHQGEWCTEKENHINIVSFETKEIEVEE